MSDVGDVSGVGDVGGDAGFGLRPRPVVDPVVAALIAEAAFDLWPRSPAADPAAEAAEAARTEQAERAWRFSGRPWASGTALPARRLWGRR